jgi:hypothetical protein
MRILYSYTVTKAKRDAGPQHMGDGKYRHQRRLSRWGSMWMTEFSVNLMLWACVTRGFFLTVYIITSVIVLEPQGASSLLLRSHSRNPMRLQLRPTQYVRQKIGKKNTKKNLSQVLKRQQSNFKKLRCRLLRLKLF